VNTSLPDKDGAINLHFESSGYMLWVSNGFTPSNKQQVSTGCTAAVYAYAYACSERQVVRQGKTGPRAPGVRHSHSLSLDRNSMQ
jgi:hypothetical protein